MSLSINTRIFWPGIIETIPAGWSRDSDFYGSFLSGVVNDVRETAGGQHLHSQNHVLTGIEHDHTFSAASATPANTTGRKRGFGAFASALIHAHPVATSNGSTITYSNNSDNLDLEDMLPPFFRMIVLKPNDSSQKIPDDAVCLTDEEEAPEGFHITDGDGGTTDLDGKYIKATTELQNGGSTGGALVHNHNEGSFEHDHDPAQHDHPLKVCGSTNQIANIDNSNLSIRPRNHHNVQLLGEELSDVSTEGITVDDASSEPAYYTLLGIQNTSGSALDKIGIILPFVGDVADIPIDWILCDGNNDTPNLGSRQIKITKTPGNIGDTGGSDEHLHNLQEHQHTHTGPHGHSPAINIITSPLAAAGLTNYPSVIKEHTHNWTIGGTTPTVNSTAAFNSGSSDGRASYRTVVFIKKITESKYIKDIILNKGVITYAR